MSAITTGVIYTKVWCQSTSFGIMARRHLGMQKNRAAPQDPELRGKKKKIIGQTGLCPGRDRLRPPSSSPVWWPGTRDRAGSMPRWWTHGLFGIESHLQQYDIGVGGKVPCLGISNGSQGAYTARSRSRKGGSAKEVGARRGILQGRSQAKAAPGSTRHSLTRAISTCADCISASATGYGAFMSRSTHLHLGTSRPASRIRKGRTAGGPGLPRPLLALHYTRTRP